MIDFLKRLFGGSTPSGPIPASSRSAAAARAPRKPTIPDDELDQFKRWYLAQNKPAVALLPDPDGPIGVAGIPFSDYSPFCSEMVRNRGLALKAEPTVDPIDPAIKDAERRILDLYDRYDLAPLDAFVEAHERPLRHHTGGYPAFTQSDIRLDASYAEYDRVLLRLTSDDNLMWGDSCEAVFMMRGADLAAGDFDAVVYSWDCC